MNKTKFYLSVLITIISIISFAQIPSDKSAPMEYETMTNPLKSDPLATQQGYRIYKKVCWLCHGNNGDGKGPQSANINTKPADLKHPVVKSRKDGALFWWISNGGNDMEAFKDALTEEQIWQVVTYIRKIQQQ